VPPTILSFFMLTRLIYKVGTLRTSLRYNSYIEPFERLTLNYIFPIYSVVVVPLAITIVILSIRTISEGRKRLRSLLIELEAPKSIN